MFVLKWDYRIDAIIRVTIIGNIMIQAASRVLRRPFYPWLLGIIPILHYYTENLILVIDTEVLPTILFMLVGTSVIFILVKRLLHDRHLTAIFTGLCSIAFSLSGHVYVEVFMPRSLGIWTILLLLGLAAIGAILRKLPSRKIFAQTTPSLNLIVLVLLFIQVIRLTIGFIELSRYVDVFVEFNELASDKPNAPKAMDSPSRPDIYYIIPDGYPSNAWLEATANFDNSAFSEALKERGFAVVNHAQSNYPMTVLSLASTLNMQYYSSNPSPYSDKMYLKLEAANSEVSEFLLDSGYTYIQLLTNSILPSPTADISRYFTPRGPIDIDIDFAAISGGTMTERTIGDAKMLIDQVTKHSFFEAYLDTTLLRLARSRLLPLIHNEQRIGFSDVEPRKFLETIDETIKISEMPEATFTIIHLLKPHQPVVFNEKGEHISWIYNPSPEVFGAELKYINTQFLYLIDSILASSEHPPVILFQADHSSVMGSAPYERMIYFDVFAAYYLLPSHTVDFPRPYTTINAFPLILNEVLNSDFEIRPDRLYEALQRYEAPFAQADVTEEFLNSA